MVSALKHQAGIWWSAYALHSWKAIALHQPLRWTWAPRLCFWRWKSPGRDGECFPVHRHGWWRVLAPAALGLPGFARLKSAFIHTLSKGDQFSQHAMLSKAQEVLPRKGQRSHQGLCWGELHSEWYRVNDKWWDWRDRNSVRQRKMCPCRPVRWRIFVLKRIWTTFVIQWIVKQTKIETTKSGKQRAAIEFLIFEGMNRDEITHRLDNVYGEHVYSHADVFGWIKDVCAGNEWPRDFGRPGRQPLWGSRWSNFFSNEGFPLASTQ